MAKFINPFTDVGFKRIFGQEPSKPLLIDFLNNLLKGEREIKELTFLDKEQPPIFDEDRALIYDVFCELVNGDKIIVEMQNNPQDFFKNRSVYYIAEALARQGERGVKWAYDIKAVYFVGFLNFHMDDSSAKLRTDVALMDMEEKTLFSDKMRMIFLQLPYFTKKFEECENDFERWICVLKNMEILDRMPEAAKTSVFERLRQIGDVSAMTREERIKYDYALKKYRDNIAVREYAIKQGLKQGMEQGLKQGREEGREEGRKEARASLLNTLFANGMPVEDIAKFLKMSEADVHSILGR